MPVVAAFPLRVGRPLLLLGAGLSVAAILWFASLGPKLEAPVQITRLTYEEGILQTDPALPPEGRFVAYASNKTGNFDVYTQPLGGGNAVRVTGHAAHDWQPDWSINDQIVFRSERDGGGLYVVGPTGGHERRVAAFGERPLWSSDGTKVLFGSLPSLKLYTVGENGDPPRSCHNCSGGAYGWFGDATHAATLAVGSAPDYELEFRSSISSAIAWTRGRSARR